MSTMLKKNGFWHSQCVVSKQHVGLYVEPKLTNVESKLLLQLLLCGFDICLFLFDRTAKIDPTEVSTCRGSFGGFESTCFQLDRAARIKTTGISYFSCDRSAHHMLIDKYHPAMVLPVFSCRVDYILEECVLLTGLSCETWRIQQDWWGAHC